MGPKVDFGMGIGRSNAGRTQGELRANDRRRDDGVIELRVKSEG
jgi:hypothetical protein